MKPIKRSIFRHAHLAGTGPQGKTCHDCSYYDYARQPAPFRARPRFCAKVERLTGQPGAFCRAQAACCFFLDISEAQQEQNHGTT